MAPPAAGGLAVAAPSRRGVCFAVPAPAVFLRFPSCLPVAGFRLPLLAMVLVTACGEAPAEAAAGAAGSAGQVQVDRAVAWGLPVVGELTVGFRVRSTGAAADTLVGATSPSGVPMLHDVVDGRMRMISAVEVAPGGTVTLGTGGPHLMLSQVPAAIWDSAIVVITLQFRQAGPVTLRVPIVTYTEAMRGLRP